MNKNPNKLDTNKHLEVNTTAWFLPKGHENAFALILWRANVVGRETTLPQGLV